MLVFFVAYWMALADLGMSFLPFRNISGILGAALASVSSERDEIKSPAMRPRKCICIWRAPGIVRDHVAFQVRSIPPFDIVWLLHERDQSKIARRI